MAWLKFCTIFVCIYFVSGDNSLAEDALKVHNMFRRRHGVPPLTLNNDVTAAMQTKADLFAKNEVLSIQPKDQYGENHYILSDPVKRPGILVSTEWYNEVYDYNFDNPGNTPYTQNFTQMIWKNTQEFGIASATSRDGLTYIFAGYLPRGNIDGEFEENVPRPTA